MKSEFEVWVIEEIRGEKEFWEVFWLVMLVVYRYFLRKKMVYGKFEACDMFYLSMITIRYMTFIILLLCDVMIVIKIIN